METRLVESAAAEVAYRQSEQRVLLCQELSSASVEGDSSSKDTEGTTGLGDRGGFGELGNHKEEEGQVKEEEEGCQSDVNPQSAQEEDEGDDEPRSQKDSDSVVKFIRGLGIGSSDTVVGMKEGRVGQPETAIRGESSGAESVTSGKLPHAGSELSETADEAGHTNDSVGDGDTPSVDVVHGENEGCASEGEETKRTRVADDPQLRGSVVDVGVGWEGASSVSALAVVVLITDVVGVANGGLFCGDGHWKRK